MNTADVFPCDSHEAGLYIPVGGMVLSCPRRVRLGPGAKASSSRGRILESSCPEVPHPAILRLSLVIAFQMVCLQEATAIFAAATAASTPVPQIRYFSTEARLRRIALAIPLSGSTLRLESTISKASGGTGLPSKARTSARPMPTRRQATAKRKTVNE